MQQPPHEPMTTRMSSKGQVVIPRLAREALGVHAGTEFSIRIEKGGYKLIPHKPDVSALFALGREFAQKYNMTMPTPAEMNKMLHTRAAELDAKTHSNTRPRRKPRP